MSKTINKTQPTEIEARNFAKQNFSPDRQKEILQLVDFFEKITGKKCVMWNKIFGFGKYHYKYDSGREGDFLATGFAVPKTGFTIYTIMGHENYPEILKDFGKYKSSGKSCLAIKKIEDINLKVLEKLIKTSLQDLNKKYKVE